MSFELQTAVTMENLPSTARQLPDHRPQSQIVSLTHSRLCRLGPRDGQLVPGWPSHQLLTWCGRGEGQEEGSSGAGFAGQALGGAVNPRAWLQGEPHCMGSGCAASWQPQHLPPSRQQHRKLFLGTECTPRFRNHVWTWFLSKAY